MRHRVLPLIVVLLPTAAAALVGESSALAQTTSAASLASALAGQQGIVTGASFVSVPPNGEPDAVMTTPLAGFPTNGSSYALLTTGDSTLAGTANTSPSSGVDDGGGHVRGDTDYDVSVLKVDLNVPAGINCLAGIDFRFLSEEYPEFVGSAYNDAFVAELDNSTWTTSGSTISAPNNFAFDPSHNPITINAAGVTSMTAGAAAGTTYDGATPILSAATPITPGAHSLYLSIFDQGDAIYDSAVMLDNLRLASVADLATQCVPGATPVQQTPTYAALGDSYSAGEGNPVFDSGTDARENPFTDATGSCHRSPASWARRLALKTSYQLSVGGHLACSNAKTSALTSSFKGEPPQLTALKSLSPKPKIVTVTVGGNDIGFPLVIGLCRLGGAGACTAAITGATALLESTLPGKLKTAYEAIHNAVPSAQILVVGYPNIMSDNLTTTVHCPWMNQADAFLMRRVASTLDSKIKSVVHTLPASDKVQYVSTLNALAGHELCTGDSYVNAVNIDPASVASGTYAYSAHPSFQGQTAMRDVVAGYINSHY